MKRQIFNEKTNIMIIMDACLSIFYLKQPKSTATTTTHPQTGLKHPPDQTACMTPTTPTLQWLA